MIDEKYGKYLDYVDDVLNEKIVANRYIRLLCKRFLDDISEESEYYLDIKECDRVVRFISNFRLFKGQFQNKPFVLQSWQKFLLYGLFGVKRKDNNERKYKQAILFIGRKNGKTISAAAIAIYQFLTSGNNSEFILAANSVKQAKIAFEMVQQFIKQLDPKKKQFKVLRDSIVHIKSNSKLFVLSSDTSGMDGYGASFICDEAESYADDKIVSTLRNGQGSLKNPLSLIIGTGGYDKLYFYDQYINAIKVLEGTNKQDTLFPMLYTLDEGDDYQDENNWIKSNPSLGITLTKDFLREQVTEAKNSPQIETSTLIKNFNIWSNAASNWIAPQYLERAFEEINIDDWVDQGISVYIGVDLAAVSDLTAVSMLWECGGTFYVKTWYYLPTETIKNSPTNKERYKIWHKTKQLIGHVGNVTDYDAIEEHLLWLSQHFNVQEIAYDSWNSTQWAIRATEDGLPLKPYSQTTGNFNRPTKELERKILNGNIIIDNNEVTRFCFSNVVIKEDYNGNIKPHKTVNENKIDGVISIIESLGSYLNNTHFNNELFTV